MVNPGLPTPGDGKIGEKRRRRDARGGKQRGYGVSGAIGGQGLQGLQDDGERDERGRNRHRPAPGDTEKGGQREIGEEMLCQPMQPGPYLPPDRNQCGGGDCRQQ